MLLQSVREASPLVAGEQRVSLRWITEGKKNKNVGPLCLNVHGKVLELAQTFFEESFFAFEDFVRKPNLVL